MTKADQLVDRAAMRLQELANKAAAEGGVAAKLAQPLADDAAFLRQLKPSLILARIKGDAPMNGKPAHGAVAPSGPQLGKRREGRRRRRTRSSSSGSPSPSESCWRRSSTGEAMADQRD